MNDTKTFEQLIASVAGEAMGPNRPVNVESIVRSAAASSAKPSESVVARTSGVDSSPRKERGSSMFSAAKLVAAAAIIAVSGGFLMVSVLQPDPTTDLLPATEGSSEPPESSAEPVEATVVPVDTSAVPAWVTGVARGHEVIGSGGRKWLEGRTTYPEEVMRAQQQSPDPRLEGIVTITYNLHELSLGEALPGGAVAGGALTAGTILVENGDGSWRGEFTGLREPDDPWSHRMHVMLEGEDGYEGLRAALLYDGSMGEGFGYSGSQTIEGYIFEGPVPEVPIE